LCAAPISLIVTLDLHIARMIRKMVNLDFESVCSVLDEGGGSVLDSGRVQRPDSQHPSVLQGSAGTYKTTIMAIVDGGDGKSFSNDNCLAQTFQEENNLKLRVPGGARRPHPIPSAKGAKAGGQFCLNHTSLTRLHG
jgi:hypothetical protein